MNNINYIYIACPYTKGDTARHVGESIEAYNELIDLGFIPFNPLFSHFSHMHYPKDDETWYKQGEEWLKRCDAVLVLEEADSVGVAREIKLANYLDIPVFKSLDALLATNAH